MANRPAVAEALLAQANADPEGDEDLAEERKDTLSPTVVAALEQSGQAARSQINSATVPTAAPFPAAVNHKVTVAPAETAKAEPEAGFGDAFDLKPSINGGLTVNTDQGLTPEQAGCRRFPSGHGRRWSSDAGSDL